MAELRKQKVFVAGHLGMVGSAIVRRLETLGYPNILTAGRDELNLLNQNAVHAWFAEHQPEQVYIAAAKVGGIHANNTYPAEFIYENLMIEANLIHAAHQSGVQKVLFLGSSCIYPKFAEQPMRGGWLAAPMVRLRPVEEWDAEFMQAVTVYLRSRGWQTAWRVVAME